VTANNTSKPDKSEALPPSPEANIGSEQSDKAGQKPQFSYQEIFAPSGKPSTPAEPDMQEVQKALDPFQSFGTSAELPPSKLLTKELLRDLGASKFMTPNLLRTFVPWTRFIDAQGLQARPYVLARKSESVKEPEKPVISSTKKDSLQITLPPLNDVETAPKKPTDEGKKGKQTKPVDDLQIDSIYADITKIPVVKPSHEDASTDTEHAKVKSVFEGLERSRPHDLALPSLGKFTKGRLRQCIENLSNGRLIVVGDLLIDELLEGKPERISREAPVLILEHVDTELVLGGAANTANNISALGGQCHAVGVSGMDEYAGKLGKLLDDHNIKHSIVHDPSRPTTVKTRILSKAHSLKQQLLRLDRISHATIDDAVQMLLVQRLAPLVKDFHGIILSDYRAGVMSQNVISGCRRLAKENKLFLFVDAQEGFERFQEVDLISPNQPDAETAVGYGFDDQNSLLRGGKELLSLTGAKALLLTRGAQGMSLFKQGQQPFHLPVFNRSEVFDVTGAGDTVAATVTLAVVTGSTLEEATALGNLAAGIVVRKPGPAVTSQQEMIENLERLNLPSGS